MNCHSSFAEGAIAIKGARFDVPILTPREVAVHVDLAPSTLHRWLSTPAAGAPLVHRIEPPTPRSASIPFIAVAEAMVLGVFRRELKLPLREIREAATRLRRELGTEYALASRRLASDGVTVLVDLAADSSAPQWARARDGQLAINEVIARYLRYVTWEKGDDYPVRLKLKSYEAADVIIDPRFAFGQPVFAASKVRVRDVVDAFVAGESMETISHEYGISVEEVEAAIRADRRVV